MNPLISSPSFGVAVAVTKSDTVDIPPPSGDARPTRAILVGGAGDLNCIFADGSTVVLTIPATACGFVLPLAITRLKSASTTATSVVAFF